MGGHVGHGAQGAVHPLIHNYHHDDHDGGDHDDDSHHNHHRHYEDPPRHDICQMFYTSAVSQIMKFTREKARK